MQSIAALISLVSLFSLTSAAGAAPARDDCAADVIALRQALSFEPVALAKQDAQNGDLRYLEVGRFERTVPGVQDQSCVRAGQLAKWLPGTTDAPCSKAHQELNDSAHDYALRYNEAMTRMRIEKGLPTCAQ